MKPNEMPQKRPLRPIQGRFSEVTRKWQTLSREQRWDEVDADAEGETPDL